MLTYKFTLHGQEVETNRLMDVINPATGDVFAKVCRADESHVDRAVESAEAAQKIWASTDLGTRQKALANYAHSIKTHRETLAELLTKEQGKTLKESLSEIDTTIEYLQYSAQQHYEFEKILQDDEDFYTVQYRHPLGVTAGIVPWNYPIMIYAFKMVHAVLTGNAIILKPAPTTPLTATLLSKLTIGIFPDGLVNLIIDNNDLGPLLSAHPKIRKISFTGSTETGKRVMAGAAKDLKHVTLELGGNDAAIILKDVNVEETAEKIFGAIFGNCGQICVAAKRIYVEEPIYDEMVAALTKLAAQAIIGNGLDPDTDIGPIQNKAQLEKIAEYLDIARKDGQITTGGNLIDGPGYFVEPTVVRDISDGSKLVDEEPFGPIIPIIKVKDAEDALARANASPYGLGGSVWSNNVKRAAALAQRLECGMAWINHHANTPPQWPFGGRKHSGIGVEFTDEGLNAFTDLQVVAVPKS